VALYFLNLQTKKLERVNDMSRTAAEIKALEEQKQKEQQREGGKKPVDREAVMRSQRQETAARNFLQGVSTPAEQGVGEELTPRNPSEPKPRVEGDSGQWQHAMQHAVAGSDDRPEMQAVYAVAGSDDRPEMQAVYASPQEDHHYVTSRQLPAIGEKYEGVGEETVSLRGSFEPSSLPATTRAAMMTSRWWQGIPDSISDDEAINNRSISPEMIEIIMLILSEVILNCLPNSKMQAWNRIQSFRDAHRKLDRIADRTRLILLTNRWMTASGFRREPGDVMQVVNALTALASGATIEEFEQVQKEVLASPFLL
jgi:hypothetical protein